MIKILILRFSSIGDIVLTTPIVRILKTQLPNATIHYFTKPQFSILLENNPYIEKLWTLVGSLDKILDQLKQENYDYIVDLHNNIRTLRIKKALGKKAFTFNKINVEKWLYVNFKIDILPPLHIVDRYIESVKLLDVANDNKGLDYFIPSKDLISRTDLPLEFQNKFAAFAIGAQHVTKKLPKVKLIQFCKTINMPVILLGGKEDFLIGEEIKIELDKSPVHAILNTCGSYNLNQSASIIQQSEVVYSHDTGLMHIASALKKRIVSIWGSTVPEFGMYPYQTAFETIENKGLHCRPCSKIGYKKCPLGHFKCMNELIPVLIMLSSMCS